MRYGYRQGKARLSAGVSEIFARLGTSAELWQHRIQRLFKRERLIGSFIATDRARLQAVAAKRACHHVDNLNGRLT